MKKKETKRKVKKKTGYDLKVSLKGTVPYQYFFKKIRGKVYRFSKTGNEYWRQDLMPFEAEPFVYWREP